MKLFRRLLLSLFPSEFQSQGANPVGMYIGFISPKQFFSVVHRRVVENYKFNMYDIGLDPFEIKIGVGEKSPLTVKETDFYYGYGSVSNLNGWGFYSPGNLSTLATVVTSVVLKEQLEGYNHRYVTSIFLATHLFSFVMVSRIKVFPEGLEEEDAYQWFIDTFFSFYKLVLKKRGVPINDDTVKEIKNTVLQKIHVFFFLFHFYKRLNKLFLHQGLSRGEFYKWLFYDEIKDGKYKSTIESFIEHAQTRSEATVFSPADKKLLGLILPVDVHLKYLYQDEHRYDVIDILLGEVFEDYNLEEELLPFIKSDKGLEEFLQELMKHGRFKNNFFRGAKKLTQKKFRLDQSYEVSKEIDDFMSTIQESGSMEGVEIPEELKKESKMMDRLLNFYVTFISGLWIGRGDTFYARMFRKPLVQELLNLLVQYEMKDSALLYYGGLLYNYTKNVFYYKYAFQNIRAGNQSFNLPIKPKSKEVHSNMYILKLFDEFFINTLLQDINKKSIKLSVTNDDIIGSFRSHIGEQVGELVDLDGKEFVEAFYRPVAKQIEQGDELIEMLAEHLTDKDYEHMRDNLYTLDQWIWRDSLELITQHEYHIAETYSDISVVGIVTTMRETVLGMMLFYTALHQSEEIPEEEKERVYHNLMQVYCIDILNISKEYVGEWQESLQAIYERYEDMFETWIQLDDNEKYLLLFVENRSDFCKQFSGSPVSKFMSGEDTVRLRGFFKTITYYNKRYLIPKQ